MIVIGNRQVISNPAWSQPLLLIILSADCDVCSMCKTRKNDLDYSKYPFRRAVWPIQLFCLSNALLLSILLTK